MHTMQVVEWLLSRTNLALLLTKIEKNLGDKSQKHVVNPPCKSEIVDLHRKHGQGIGIIDPFDSIPVASHAHVY